MNRFTRNYIRILAIPTFVTLYLIAMYLITNRSSHKVAEIAVEDSKLSARPQQEQVGYIDNLLHPIDAIDHVMREINEEDDQFLNDEFQEDVRFVDDEEPDNLFIESNEEDSDDITGNDPVYNDVKSTLAATTLDIMNTTRIKFLKDVKNPCFALNSNMENVGNIEMGYALQEGFDVKCLPYAIIAGFDGCGTDELLQWLTTLNLVRNGQQSQPNISAKAGQQHPHFWDNLGNKDQYTLEDYSNLYTKETKDIIESFKPSSTTTTNNKELLIVDGTPSSLWYGHNWNKEDLNKQLDEPRLLLPHKIHHVLPKTKIIVMLRSPTDRLIMDFLTYYKGSKSDKVLKEKMLIAIEWWKHCLEDLRLPLRTCAYGKSPHVDLDPLDFEQCFYKSENMTLEPGTFCDNEVAWSNNPADRLRIGLYYVFLKDWLKIFPKEQFLFIKYETFIERPFGILESKVLPFLDLPELTTEERLKLKPLEEGLKSSATIPFEASELTRSILDDFYQLPLRTLQEEYLDGDKTFFWPPIFKPITKRPK